MRHDLWTLNPEIIKRYESGESTATLAESFGCAQQTITRALQKSGVKIRPKGPISGIRPHTAKKLRKIRELRNAGLKWKDVGEQINMESGSAHALAAKYADLQL